MSDEGLVNFQAVSRLPTFRSYITGSKGIKSLHRRKYQWIGGALTLKTNAQER